MNDDRFRFTLTRDLAQGHLAVARSARPSRLVVVMLNPSTADDVEDDPTIRRVMGFARGVAAEELTVVNLLAERATDPRDLTEAAWQESKGRNDEVIQDAFDGVCEDAGDRVLVAWGSKPSDTPKGSWLRRALGDSIDRVVGHSWPDVEDLSLTLWCLGTTSSGQPRHPLYLRADTQWTPWRQP